MAFCTQCGKEIKDDMIYCPFCGVSRKPTIEEAADPQDIEDTKVLSVLAYFGLLVLVTIFGAPKKSVYARFHANQGLLLLILNIGLGIIRSILDGIDWVLGALGGIIALLDIFTIPIGLGILVIQIYLTVVGVMHAVKGEMKELPVIGKYRILK